MVRWDLCRRDQVALSLGQPQHIYQLLFTATRLAEYRRFIAWPIIAVQNRIELKLHSKRSQIEGLDLRGFVFSVMVIVCAESRSCDICNDI